MSSNSWIRFEITPENKATAADELRRLAKVIRVMPGKGRLTVALESARVALNNLYCGASLQYRNLPPVNGRSGGQEHSERRDMSPEDDLIKNLASAGLTLLKDIDGGKASRKIARDMDDIADQLTPTPEATNKSPTPQGTVKDRIAEYIEQRRARLSELIPLWKVGDREALRIGEQLFGPTAVAKEVQCSAPAVHKNAKWKIDVGQYLYPKTHGNAADPLDENIDLMRDYLNPTATARKSRRGRR